MQVSAVQSPLICRDTETLIVSSAIEEGVLLTKCMKVAASARGL